MRTTSSTERLLDPAPGNSPGHVAQPARDGRADVRGAVRLSRHARHVHHLHPAAHPRVRRQQRREGFSHSSAQERRAAQQRRTDEAAALRDPSEIPNVPLGQAVAAHRHPAADFAPHRL